MYIYIVHSIDKVSRKDHLLIFNAFIKSLLAPETIIKTNAPKVNIYKNMRVITGKLYLQKLPIYMEYIWKSYDSSFWMTGLETYFSLTPFYYIRLAR